MLLQLFNKGHLQSIIDFEEEKTKILSGQSMTAFVRKKRIALTYTLT